MIRGETITVLVCRTVGEDVFGEPVVEWVVEADVENVLVSPASTRDLDGSIRPDGDSLDVQLHFPKTYTAPLRGKRVRVGGEVYEVVGNPIAYQSQNTPTPWDRPVTARLVEG
ncbi:hypothetical protein G7Y41_07080 [Schaalia sp. ZJ405]|uniref:hypothetical protein n=1 Tax=Schaalia sp. ZJ405 TaxID=2709403 RepID=UPI0013EDF34E|nr:hypothetical protein [Schaalia sp. ZJ405]QPK80816.1 hypothetical protein G7Y41_07080 [Schaalia sp. ZJ405]